MPEFIFSQKPVFCRECGKKMKDLHSISYDPQTGEKIFEGVYVMQCSNDSCSRFSTLCTDGSWKQ